jgi:hypothetical protein
MLRILHSRGRAASACSQRGRAGPPRCPFLLAQQTQARHRATSALWQQRKSPQAASHRNERPPAKTTYRSDIVLVKFPLAPLALIWLLPKEVSEPDKACTPVPLPPTVDAATSTLALAELVSMATPKLAEKVDSSIVKNTPPAEDPTNPLALLLASTLVRMIPAVTPAPARSNPSVVLPLIPVLTKSTDV